LWGGVNLLFMCTILWRWDAYCQNCSQPQHFATFANSSSEHNQSP